MVINMYDTIYLTIAVFYKLSNSLFNFLSGPITVFSHFLDLFFDLLLLNFNIKRAVFFQTALFYNLKIVTFLIIYNKIISLNTSCQTPPMTSERRIIASVEPTEGQKTF